MQTSCSSSMENMVKPESVWDTDLFLASQSLVIWTMCGPRGEVTEFV